MATNRSDPVFELWGPDIPVAGISAIGGSRLAYTMKPGEIRHTSARPSVLFVRYIVWGGIAMAWAGLEFVCLNQLNAKWKNMHISECEACGCM